MSDTRRENVKWNVGGDPLTWEKVQVALLMDIRDELQNLNNLLGCHNAIAVPTILRQIARNTSRARCRACPRSFDSTRGLRQHEARAHA